MEMTAERKIRIENLRKQLPFLNQYQKESQNEELKKHSMYIMNLFKKAEEQGKDINIPDHKIDLLIASVEKLKEYTKTVKKDDTKKAASPKPVPKVPKKEPVRPIKKEVTHTAKKEPVEPKKNDGFVEPKKSDESLEPMIKLPINTSLNDSCEPSISELNLSEKERKRREKELKRLQENIVKDEIPLPSRRVIKRNSRYMDDGKDKNEENVSPKRKSESEKSFENRPLPHKTSKTSIEAPTPSPVRTVRANTDTTLHNSADFTTSTPKLSKASPSIERVLPMKRKSETSLETSTDLKVPPLKISTLAKRAAEKSMDIKRVLPVKRTSDPIEDVVVEENSKSPKQKKSKVSKLDVTEEGEIKQRSDLNRKDIENMGYVAVRSGYIFQCLAENCFYNTIKKFAFIGHLEENHENVKWSGHCGLCSCVIDIKDKSKEGEFWHMMEHVHEEKSNPEELPDIVELPKEPAKLSKPMIISDDTNDSAVTNSVRDSDDETTLTDQSATDSKNSTDTKVVQETSNDEKTSEAPKITVKSFANVSQFQSSKTPLNTVLGQRFKLLKPMETSRVVGPTKVFIDGTQIPLNSLKIVKPNEVKAPGKVHDLKALMQKQTEENLRKLQIAAKSAQIIPNTGAKPGVSLLRPTVPKKDDLGPKKLILMPQQKPQAPKNQFSETKIDKFYIAKPTPGVIEVQVNVDSKTMKDTINLRPWLNKPIKKVINSKIKMLEKEALVATFKCMGKNCDYYTNSWTDFDKHLKNHLETTPGDIANYIICPYCDYCYTQGESNPTTNLIKHIFNEHGFDKFQCKYCFYRSCANFNVIEHQKMHHRMQPPKYILLSASKKREYHKELEEIKQNCGKFIKGLVCATCKINGASLNDSKFYILKKYLLHLKEHERNKEIVKAACKKCRKTCDTAESLYSHIFQCFENLALYQCVYCLYGTNAEEKIYEHMSNHHPSKLAVMCIRSDDQPMREGAPLNHYQSTTLKFISKQIDESNVVILETSNEDATKKQTVQAPKNTEIQIQNVYSLSSS